MADSVEVSTIETTDGTIGVIRDNAARQSIANIREGKETVGSVAWENVKGRPTKVSELENDKNYQTDENVSNTLNSTLYAGSSTHGGPATSADKLTTARTISLSGAAAGSGSFDGSANSTINVSSLDATKLTGVVSITNLPPSVVERMSIVKDDTERLALTKDKVQDGDVVKVQSSGLIYYVVDDDKLNEEAGYEVFKAGTAASVPWGGVTDKPSSYPPSSHTHTKAQITDFPSSLPNPSNLTMQIEGNNAAVYNGGTSQTFNVTKSSLGLDKVNNTADADKSVKYAASAGNANTATGHSLGLNIPSPSAVDQDKFLSGKGVWESITGKIVGTKVASADTADKLATARNITVGSSSKKFDGSSDVSYSLSEIGAQPSGYYATLIPTGAAIHAGDDLNNISYTAVGTYYCSAIAEAQHISNLPEATAFMMTVYNPLGTLTGPVGGAWQYRVQEFMSFNGTQKYIRMVSTDGKSNVTFNDWVKMTNSNDLGAVSNTINTHIANKSNPHGVTKDQVGLGNVDNTADADKSVKSAAFLSASDKSKTVATVPYYSYNQLNSEFGTTGSDTETYLKNWVKKIMKSYSDLSGIVIVGSANPNAAGTIIFRAYNLGNYNNTGFPQYCEGQYFGLQSSYYAFNTYNGVWHSHSFVLDNQLASQSSNGLMSKSDKAKLDGIGTGSNVKSVNGKTGAVTLAKGDVGLGSVANLDQSKAIKSITRNGTTFTATALDGTTTTFTQQDNNTTYGLASQSSNGLMSKSDKAKLDGLVGGSKTAKYTLTASKWSGSSAPYTYDLGSTYGNNSVIGFDSAVGSTAQLEAALSANIQGSSTTKIYAYGDKPTVDIPIVIIYQ